MRSREVIEGQLIAARNEQKNIIAELLMDIRELLIRQGLPTTMLSAPGPNIKDTTAQNSEPEHKTQEPAIVGEYWWAVQKEEGAGLEVVEIVQNNRLDRMGLRSIYEIDDFTLLQKIARPDKPATAVAKKVPEVGKRELRSLG